MRLTLPWLVDHHPPEPTRDGFDHSVQAIEALFAQQAYLRPYRNNTLILDTDDLGPDALIETGTLQLVPLRGAIVKATFAARKVTRLVLTLMQADGRPLPFGATVKDEQGQTLAVVGQAGQALVAIDASEQALRVDWHDQRPQQCAFDIDVAHMRQDGGYHLQTLHCQPR